MSIAVAVTKAGKTAIAADSQENFGDRKLLRSNHRSEKILPVGASWVATTGWGLYDNILRDYLARRRPPRLSSDRDVFAFFLRFWKELRERYPLVNDQPHDDDPTPFADIDSSFLIANRAGIFQVSGNLSVTKFEEYYAIGSGASYALGALHALHDGDFDAPTLARRACAAAMAFDINCGGEIDVFLVSGPSRGAPGRPRRGSAARPADLGGSRARDAQAGRRKRLQAR